MLAGLVDRIAAICFDFGLVGCENEIFLVNSVALKREGLTGCKPARLAIGALSHNSNYMFNREDYVGWRIPAGVTAAAILPLGLMLSW